MCIDFEAQGHPMDRPPARALFLGCAESLCGSNGTAAAGSQQCAGLLLDLWLQV